MANGYLLLMRKNSEESRQLVQHERTLQTRLQLATTRLEEAERERIWAIVAAHTGGLSIRNIAAATGLSRSRIHQLLHERHRYRLDESREKPPARTAKAKSEVSRKTFDLPSDYGDDADDFRGIS